MSLPPGIYAGAIQCFQTALQISQDAVDDDQEEELESYDAAIEIDAKLALEDSSEMSELINDTETNLDKFDPPITPRFQNLSVDTEGMGDDPTVGSTATMKNTGHETMFNALKVASKNVVGNSTLQLYIR